MPTEIPPLYRIREQDDYGVVVYLDTDAQSFWAVIVRHALNNLAPLYGGGHAYRVLGRGNAQVSELAPSLNEWGTYIWLGHFPGSKSDYGPPEGRLSWEMIGPSRLRVVYDPISDLPPNLNMAWNILSTIWRVYPEAREQLPDMEGIIESWAYDEATQTWWRDQVKERRGLTKRSEEWRRSERAKRGVTQKARTEGIPQDDVPDPAEIMGHLRHLSPGSEEWWHSLFSWYTDYIKTGHRLSQRELADLCGYSPSHTKRKLGEWKAQYDGGIPNETE